MQEEIKTIQSVYRILLAEVDKHIKIKIDLKKKDIDYALFDLQKLFDIRGILIDKIRKTLTI